MFFFPCVRAIVSRKEFHRWISSDLGSTAVPW